MSRGDTGGKNLREQSSKPYLGSLLKNTLSFLMVSAFVIIAVVWVQLWGGSQGNELKREINIGDVSHWERPAVATVGSASSPVHETGMWGSWRPGVYFGLKSRGFPVYLSTGIMWTRSGSNLLRHSAVQDELALFEWVRHDGKNYGKHRAVDKQLGAEIVSSFVIPQNPTEVSWAQRFDVSAENEISMFFYFGSDCDGNLPEKECFLANPTVLHDVIESVGQPSEHEEPSRSLVVKGHSMISGDFEVQFNLYADFSGRSSMTYWSPSKKTVPYAVDKINKKCKQGNAGSIKKDVIFENDSSAFLNRWNRNSSVFVIQITLTGIATLDVIFNERVGKVEEGKTGDRTVVSRALISSWISERENQFEKTFRETYEVDSLLAEASKKVVSAVLGGIGLFVGYPEIGNASSVDLIHSGGVRNSSGVPFELFSGTPSRTSFPRGFLWDEGFHLLVSSKWSLNIGAQILTSWMKSMFSLSYKLDSNGRIMHPNDSVGLDRAEMGWIPRELILGRDALEAVPREFVTQRVDVANPPTLMLAIEKMIDRVEKYVETCVNDSGGAELCDSNVNINVGHSIVHRFLMENYVSLCKWMKWYFVSQQGPDKNGRTFRWRGRSSSDGKLLANTLASGLDDYPRALFPNEDEYHVDLYCWMVKFAAIMAKVDAFLGHGHQMARDNFFSSLPRHSTAASVDTFDALAFSLSENLDKLHWSDERKAFVDVGLHSNDFKIIEEFVYRCLNPKTGQTTDIGLPGRVLFSRNSDLTAYCPKGYNKGYPLGGDNNGYMSREKIEVKPGSESVQQIAHIGYVTLFPFLLTIIPTGSPKLEHLLDIIEYELLTPYGLRSLSVSNAFYSQSNAPGDNPYWRGYIWLNINYLAVTSLKHYEIHAEYEQTRLRCGRLYTTLRQSLVSNVLKEYNRTGYLWEQYDDRTGVGTRGHPFSGWTALIVNIISESY